jgi:anoctamin-10
VLTTPQFGESVALYFSFLSAYTHFLIFPAALGVATYWFGTPYSSIYSILLVLWSITFTEWWRIRERILSVRWRTRGSFRVERQRAHFDEKVPRWRRDLRATASAPVILLFAGVLGCLLTAIFVFEAFITQLYTGPGHQYIVSYFVLNNDESDTDLISRVWHRQSCSWPSFRGSWRSIKQRLSN